MRALQVRFTRYPSLSHGLLPQYSDVEFGVQGVGLQVQGLEVGGRGVARGGGVRKRPTGVPHSQENESPEDSTVGLCLGS